MNDIGIGHNRPDMTATAVETMNDLSHWMAEHPIIDSMEMAREAKPYLDRGKLCIKDLEDERKQKTSPLRQEVEKINTYYNEPKGALEGVLEILQSRIGLFIKAEEARREAEALAARQRVAEAERFAREAERIEQEGIENAKAGELGIDTAENIKKADESFKAFEKATREAGLLEREAESVKISGGFSRSISGKSINKKKEVFVVVNPIVAMNEIGLTDDIREAIVKSARAFRKLRGRLPNGVESEMRDEL